MASAPERILGLFSGSHMAYELDRTGQNLDQPSLAEMANVALDILERNPRGYFLLIEAGRVDHALHNTNARRAIVDLLAADEALGLLLDRTNPEEDLVLFTADHDHTLVIAGYPDVRQDVFAVAGTDLHNRPYTTLLFATGNSPAPADTLEPRDLANPDYRERSGVPLRSEAHGGMDVPLYAFGPRWLLDRIPGTADNTWIFGYLREAMTGAR